MTRDEAVKKAREGWSSGSSELWLVNALEQLGMLKLDEPESALDRFCDAYHGQGSVKSCGSAIAMALDCAGLRLVEK